MLEARPFFVRCSVLLYRMPAGRSSPLAVKLSRHSARQFFEDVPYASRSLLPEISRSWRQSSTAAWAKTRSNSVPRWRSPRSTFVDFADPAAPAEKIFSCALFENLNGAQRTKSFADGLWPEDVISAAKDQRSPPFPRSAVRAHS